MSSLLCQPLPRRHFFRIETKWLFFFYEVRCISKALCFNVNGTLHIILYTHKYVYSTEKVWFKSESNGQRSRVCKKISIKRNKEYPCIQIIIILKRTVGYFQWHGEIVQTKILQAQLMVFFPFDCQ